MSDETTTTEATETAVAPEAKTFTQDQVNAMLADTKRKEQSKFADYGDLKTKATQFDAFAESQKTEIQKAVERAEAAESALATSAAERAQDAKKTLWLSAIAKHEIPADYQEFIFGDTEEELDAKALKVKALIPAAVQETAPLLRELYVPGEAVSPDLALNSDGLEAALKTKLGIA